MEQVVLVVHLLLAVALVGVVLLQKSEGGGLGIGGGGGMSGFMTGRSQANLLTRATAILAFAFMVTSLVLAILATGATEQRSILDTAAPVESAPAPAGTPVPEVPAEPQSAPAPEPAPAPAETAPEAPAAPAAPEGDSGAPSVPLGQ